LRGANADGRLRGTVQFNGAGRTGRWAGRTFQPHNLPRPSKGFDHAAQLEAVDAVKAGVADLVADNVMQLTSDLLRGVIVAAGQQAVRGGPVQHRRAHARLACRRGVEAAGLSRLRRGHAAPTCTSRRTRRAFKIDAADVDYYARQIGKVMELMLGYEGGVGAFLTGAATYGFDVEELGRKAYDTIPGHILHEAGEFYDWAVQGKAPDVRPVAASVRGVRFAQAHVARGAPERRVAVARAAGHLRSPPWSRRATLLECRR
jgi:DNA polymerase